MLKSHSICITYRLHNTPNLFSDIKIKRPYQYDYDVSITLSLSLYYHSSRASNTTPAPSKIQTLLVTRITCCHVCLWIMKEYLDKDMRRTGGRWLFLCATHWWFSACPTHPSLFFSCLVHAWWRSLVHTNTTIPSLVSTFSQRFG